MRWKDSWTDPPEDVAIDVLPCSNGEYVPKDPSPNQLKIMALQNEKIEETRRRFNMTRRDFVRTSAAYAIGVWAIDKVTAGKWGHFAFADGTRTPEMCDLENPGTQLANLPGEFILETQGHTLDSGGRWRTENPGFEFFLAQWTTQAMGDMPGLRPDGKPRGFGAGEVDWVENLSRVHYFKEMFLDSSTTVSLLTALPEPARRDQHHAHQVRGRDPRPGQLAVELGALLHPRLHHAQPGLAGSGSDAHQPGRGLRVDGIGRRAPRHPGLEAVLRLGQPVPQPERLVVRRRQRHQDRRAHPPDAPEAGPAGGDLHPQGAGLQRDVRLGQVLAPGHGPHRPDVPRHHLLHLPLGLRRRAPAPLCR